MEYKGQIPVLFIEEDNIPLAYEKALSRVWNEGIAIKTEYDKPEDPPSRDATVAISIKDPFAQPRFHRELARFLATARSSVQLPS